METPCGDGAAQAGKERATVLQVYLPFEAGGSYNWWNVGRERSGIAERICSVSQGQPIFLKPQHLPGSLAAPAAASSAPKQANRVQ